MIPQPTSQTLSAHQQALEIPKSYDSEDPLEQLRRSLWSMVYAEAQQVADKLNTEHSRAYDAQDIVNHWYLELENDAQLSHDFKAHDRTTGFKTIAQELKAHADEENDLAYKLWEAEFRKWWYGGKQGIKPTLPARTTYRIAQFKDVETFGKDAWSEMEDEIESLQRLRERREELRQDSAEDPENPHTDERGNTRLAFSRCLFDRHDPANPKFKARGQKGVMGGIYQDTYPEPTYRKATNRKYLLKALLRSDNVLEVELAKGMNRNFKFPADKRAKANAKKL